MFFSTVNRVTDPEKLVQNAPVKIYWFAQCSSKQNRLKASNFCQCLMSAVKYYESVRQECCCNPTAHA